MMMCSFIEFSFVEFGFDTACHSLVPPPPSRSKVWVQKALVAKGLMLYGIGKGFEAIVMFPDYSALIFVISEI